MARKEVYFESRESRRPVALKSMDEISLEICLHRPPSTVGSRDSFDPLIWYGSARYPVYDALALSISWMQSAQYRNMCSHMHKPRRTPKTWSHLLAQLNPEGLFQSRLLRKTQKCQSLIPFETSLLCSRGKSQVCCSIRVNEMQSSR